MQMEPGSVIYATSTGGVRYKFVHDGAGPFKDCPVSVFREPERPDWVRVNGIPADYAGFVETAQRHLGVGDPG